jgi:hypothetical protein
VLVTSPDPYKLKAMLAREVARKAMLVVTPPEMIRPGVWAAEVYQFRRMERTWVRPAAVAGGVVGSLAVLGGAVWWVATTVTAVLAGVSWAGLAGAAVLLVLLARPWRSRGGGCTTTIIIKHRPGGH